MSAATILSMQLIVAAQHFSYVELADEIRAHFIEPDATRRELFSRIMFNILVGNTDDHARNHAAFILADGLALSPSSIRQSRARTCPRRHWWTRI